jgi:hypothetical protein
MKRAKATGKAARSGGRGIVNIACLNMAKTDLGVGLGPLTKALQKCYDLHFLPVWGYPVKLYTPKKAKPTDWQLVFLDDTDRAGQLAFHELTKKGQPVSKVFVKSTLEAGESVSRAACHELFEMVIDPLANLWADAADGTQYAYELSDAVEDDSFEVDGIEMSNFLYPAWFEPYKHPKGTKFDHLGRLRKPFTMTKGGYVIIRKNGKVTEEFGSPAKEQRFAEENRRGHRSEYRKGARGLLIERASKRR